MSVGIINYLSGKLLKNQVFEEQLKRASIVDIALQVLPGKYSSVHNNKITDNPVSFFFIIRHFFLVFLLIGKYCFKKHNKSTDKNYSFDFLVLVPNRKFVSNLEVVKSNLKVDYKIISIANIDEENHINIKQYMPYRFKIIIRFSILLITYSILSLRNRVEFRKLLNNLDLVQKLIFNILVFNEFFKKYHFKKYFSLLPNIDHHYIIETYFRNKFINTFAIRVAATTFANEHRYIKTDVLFYKSALEKKIYESLLIDRNIKLLPASLLVEIKGYNTDINNLKCPKRVVFLDTCLMNDERYNTGRTEAITDFYRVMARYSDVKIFHKFHPAIDSNSRKSTLETIGKNASFIDDYDPDYLQDAELIVGFYSTVYQTAILQKTPIILLEHTYSFKNETVGFKDYDLESAPVIKVNNSKELNDILFRVFCSKQPYSITLNTSSLFNWYKELYNYPEGLKSMFRVLNSR